MRFLFYLNLVFACSFCAADFSIHCPQPKYQLQGCIEQNAALPCVKKQILIPGFPSAYNPTIMKRDSGYTLFFRYDEVKSHKLYKTKFQFMTYIGYVDLDADWKVISPPKLLKMKSPYCEDPRVVAFQDKWVLFFNEIYPQHPEKRGMKMAVLNPQTKEVEKFYALPGGKKMVEKNWTPFVRHTDAGDELYYVYDFDDLSIFRIHLTNGKLTTTAVHEKAQRGPVFTEWKETYGAVRGGAPLLYIDGEYWSFFHSMFSEMAEDKQGRYMKHFYHPGLLRLNFEKMEVTGFLRYPLFYDGAFQTNKTRCFNKWIVYPSGALYNPEEETITLAVAENDSAIYLVKYEKELLKNALITLS